MKEKFENRKLTGPVNVTCKYDDGTQRMWTQRKEEVVALIVQIITAYRKQNLVLTLRQLHYQMVSHNAKYVNYDSAYKKLGNILDDCRYSGVIDWDAIEDRGRVPYIPWSADSVDDALNTVLQQYRRDRQSDQDIVVELWTEKDALSGILRRPTSKYHVRLVVNKGYSSSSAMYDAYERIKEAYNNNKKFVLLYFGDHDPSGLDMVRDIEDRLTFMMREGEEMISDPEDWFEVKHIGLTMAQVKRYNLPPNPTKLTDSRSNAYIEKYGETCWEVDALEPAVLINLVEQFIQSTIDIDKYEEILKLERADKTKIRSIMNDQSGDNDVDDEENLDEDD